MSEFKPIGQTVEKVMRDLIKISGDVYEILSPEEADQRRQDFVSDPELAASVDKFASYLGKEYADKYFDKVFYNLKYRDIAPLPKLKNCPCVYRKKFNPSYICYGMRCPHKNQ